MTTLESTADLRYPIGKFDKTSIDAPGAREQAIADIAALPEKLRAAAAGLTEAQLGTPYRDGGWTVRQVLHHVADSHINAYTRFKLALTEEFPTIKPYEEALWAELRDTREVPVETSLVLLDAIHQRWVSILRGMTDEDFTRGFTHPEQNRVVLLREATGMYAWHGKHHTAHVTALRERMRW